MDISKIIRENYKVTVPNPEYNPRAKKNKKPKYIDVENLGKRQEGYLEHGITHDYPKDWLVPTDSIKKFEDYGLTYNKISQDLNLELAEKQSNFAKTRNALAQTIVSEIGLGTVRGVSDLVDGIYNVCTGQDTDYSSPFSEFLKQKQEEFKEYAPVYSDTNKSILNGGFTDWGWWMSNLPSVMSSLTLLIPSTGLTKGLSALGKIGKSNSIFSKLGSARRFVTRIDDADRAYREGKALTNAQKLSMKLNSKGFVDSANRLVEFGVNGFTSRIMENYQEANQVFSESLGQISDSIKSMEDAEYNALLERNNDILQGVDTTNKDEVSRRLAKAAADETFRDDMVNGIFDVIQLYALRNINPFKNGPTRASVRRAHLNTMKYPGKTAEDIEQLLANRKWYQKAGDKLSDWFVGSSLAVGAQLSEGAEEAINYIAQEEGLHYGQVLLGTIEPGSFLDDRLEKYLVAPQLWDSAFWGLMGGVVFQGLGSQFNKLSNALKVREGNKRRVLNEETKEKVSSVSWLEGYEDPTVRNRTNQVYRRAALDTKLKEDLANIKDGKDPYTPGQKLNTAEEKEIAKQKALNRRRVDLFLDALFNGTWNITKEYVENDALRDWFVDNGIASSREEAARIQQEDKALADKIETLYDQNMRAVSNAMHGTDKKTGINFDDIPIEYMQLLVAENIRNQLNADLADDAIALYQPEIASEEERIKDKLNENGISYKDAVSQFVLINQLGQIEAELKAAKKRDKERKTDNIDARTIAGQAHMDALERRKKVLLSMIREDNITGTNALSRMLLALRSMAGIERDADTNYRVNEDAEMYKKLDEAILKGFNEESNWESNRKVLSSLFKDIAGQEDLVEGITFEEFKAASENADVFSENVSLALGVTTSAPSTKKTLSDLANVSQNLLDKYTRVKLFEIEKRMSLANVVRDKDSIIQEAYNMHNQQDRARGFALELALNFIKGVAKAHTDVDNIHELLAWGTLNSDYRSQLKRILTDAELRTYDDAMKIASLNNVKRNKNRVSLQNSLLPEYIRRALWESSYDKYSDYIEGEMEAPTEATTETTTTTEEKSTESKKPAESKVKPKPTTTSPEVKKPSEEPKKGVFPDFTKNVKGKNIPPRCTIWFKNGKPTIVNQYDSDAKANKISTPSDVAIIPQKDFPGTYELDYISDTDQEGFIKLPMTNPVFTTDLFTINVPITDGGVVLKNPRITIDEKGSVVDFTPGIIGVSETEEGREAEEGQEEIEEGREEDEDKGEHYTSPTGEVPLPIEGEHWKLDEELKGDLNDEQLEEEDELLDDIFFDLARALNKATKDADGNVDAAEVIKELWNTKYKSKTRLSKFQQTVNTVLPKVKATLEKKGGIKVLDNLNTLYSTISDAELQDTISEANRSKLTNAFKAVLDDFAKRAYIGTIDGKPAISIENLLRYVIDVTGNPLIASKIYDYCKDILGEDYILLDAKASKVALLSQATLSSDEKIDNYEEKNNGRSISLDYIIEAATEDERKQIFEALDNAKPGQEIETALQDNGRGVSFYLEINGKKIRIASNPIPQRDVTATRLLQVNKGWVYDVPIDSRAGVSSLETLFKQILLNPNKDPNIDKALAILYELYNVKYLVPDYDSVSVGGKISYIENPEYVEKADRFLSYLRDAGIPIDDFMNTSPQYASLTQRSYTNAERVQHLVNIHRDITTNVHNLLVSDENQEQLQALANKIRERSITAWFAKVSDGLKSTENLRHGSKIVIDSINEGGLIITSREEALPINDEKAIGPAHREFMELAAASITEQNKVISTNPSANLIFKNVKPGSTFVTIQKADGTVAYVHAYGRNLSEFEDGSIPNKMLNDIEKEFTRLITEWGKNPNLGTEAIKAFINRLTNTDNHDALFKGIEVTDIKNDPNLGIKLKFGSGKNVRYIFLFNKSPFKDNVSTIDFGNSPNSSSRRRDCTKDDQRTAAIESFMKEVKEHLSFTMSFAHISGNEKQDNNTAGNKDGKFVVKITNDGEEYVFDSYKDFVVNNGLISVTTKHNGNTNFYRPGAHRTLAEKPRITFKFVNTSPVGRFIPVSNTTLLGDNIRDFIKEHGSDTNSLQHIINSLLSDSDLALLKDSKFFKDLGVSRIIYIDSLPQNGIAAAVTKNEEGRSYKIGDIFVSKRWVDLVNSGKKEEAFRHLIHEVLHYKLATIGEAARTEFFNEVRKVFNKFVETNKRENNTETIFFEYKNTLSDSTREDRYYTNGEINEIGLEEFVVESVTRPLLMRRLNEVSDKKSEGTITHKSSNNLFRRVLLALAKLFNININKGSLLAKEYNLFSKLMSNDTTTADAITEEDLNAPPAPSAPTTPTTPNKETVSEMDLFSKFDVLSAASDAQITGLDEIRDKIPTENVENLDRLVYNGGIQIAC